MGGMIPAIERSYPQSEIAEASYQYQRAVEERRRIIVGVNAYSESNNEHIDLLQIDESAEALQCEKLSRLRARRDNARVQRTLDQLRDSARSTGNTMPHILEAVRAYATVGEICDAFRDVFGTYEESSVL
jgi:methylmalonyl-CoA mutase N-terminal domain/subunit